MRRAVGFILVLSLTSCASYNPLTGASTRPPGTYTVNISPSGCGAVIDSNTLKGGPSVFVQRTPEGDCNIEVRHNPSIEELQPILGILGAI